MFGREQTAQVIDGSEGCKALRKGRSIKRGRTATDAVGGKTAVDWDDTRGGPAGESMMAFPVLGLAFDVAAVDAGLVPSFDDEYPQLSEWVRLPIEGLVSSTEATLPHLADAVEACSTSAIVRLASGWCRGLVPRELSEGRDRSDKSVADLVALRTVSAGSPL
jgi:hypothetical protein